MDKVPQVTKTLHLLRHAKSDRDDDAANDHDRPLAKRGVRAGTAMAKHFKDSGFAVDRVYCSTAQRTRETYDLVAPALGGAPVAFRDRLYLLDAKGLLQFIREAPDSAQAILMIGHDPGYHTLATMLVQRAAPGRESELAALREKFPTGALCSIEFSIPSWQKLAGDSGVLLDFVRPRDLDD
jgi:phosphohistidine phosphatase